jgi:peptidoglycan/xylan/chitin deacetylase (PgdA/CDA1 family)
VPVVRAVWAAVAAAVAVAAGSQLRLPDRLPARTLRVPILMYHRVGGVPAHAAGPFIRGLTVPPRVFAAEMEWLARNGFHAISQVQLLEALERGARLPPKPVMITFDDGYRDVLYNAAPLLRRLHMAATAYVITSRVGGPDPSFLDWGELRTLERDGFTIGSHSEHHLDLTALPPAQAWRELAGSRALLERRLGQPVLWFAYPAGSEDARVVALTRRAGYLLAVTTQPGELQSARRPLLLHRDEIRGDLRVASFAALLHSAS